uniref:S-formylglutathione hydrolase n=1 Tax=Flexibacterium corallicola TaxID=3037259 RepID=UPI0038620A4E
MELISESKSFGGYTKHYSHTSQVLSCSMRFAIFLPEQVANQKLPVIYWLSGLTCADENFIQKAGAQRLASQLGVILVAPDTSPRGDNVADNDAYDLGKGAGFYVTATQEPWKTHYNMYEYVRSELPELIEANFSATDRRSIMGHSMGGHGALTVAFKNPDRYASVSAFSPISSPLNCPWGEKALTAYLGEDRSNWEQYDATCLMGKTSPQIPTLVDQGDADNFLEEQLKPQLLQKAADECGYPLQLNMRPGYDHSYNFIASFIDDHLHFHANHLRSS